MVLQFWSGGWGHPLRFDDCGYHERCQATRERCRPKQRHRYVDRAYRREIFRRLLRSQLAPCHLRIALYDRCQLLDCRRQIARHKPFHEHKRAKGEYKRPAHKHHYPFEPETRKRHQPVRREICVTQLPVHEHRHIHHHRQCQQPRKGTGSGFEQKYAHEKSAEGQTAFGCPAKY